MTEIFVDIFEQRHLHGCHFIFNFLSPPVQVCHFHFDSVSWTLNKSTLFHSPVALGHSPVCPEVNTADAQVVPRPDEPRL